MTSLGILSNATITDDTPFCNPTPCAPCYYRFNSSTIEFPYEVANETQTISLVAYVTDMPDGTPTTSYSTINPPPANATTDLFMTYLPTFTWEHESGIFLTWPTSYLSVFDIAGKATADWKPPKSDEGCNPWASLSPIGLPDTTNPASFIIPITAPPTLTSSVDPASLGLPSLTDINDLEQQQDSSLVTHTVTSGQTVQSILPASLLIYLGNLSTVNEQFSNVPLSSCLPGVSVSQPISCKSLITSIYDCTEIAKNSTGLCTSIRSTTSYRFETTAEAIDTATMRKTAGALVYAISTATAIDPFMTPGSALQGPPDEDSEQDQANLEGESGMTGTNVVSTMVPFSEESATLAGDEEGQSNIDAISDSAATADQPIQLPSAGGSSDNRQDDTIFDSTSGSLTVSEDGSRAQQTALPGSGSVAATALETPHTAGVHTQVSQSSQPDADQSSHGVPEDSSGSMRPGLDPGALQSVVSGVVSQAADSKAAVSQAVESLGSATGPAVSEATTDAIPAFTFYEQTLTAGGAATFGGSPLSILASQDGFVIGGSSAVPLSDGQATIVQQGAGEPVTISRSGSVYVVDEETLSPGQQATAGRTIVSIQPSFGVLYVNGASTTLAGPSITLDGTVYTAVETSASASASDGGLGGYIYSRIGGSTAGTREGSSNATGAVLFTGDGSRTQVWSWYVMLCALAVIVVV